jgi:gliding motility-associated-like protein
VTVSDINGCKAAKTIEINEPTALNLNFQEQSLQCSTDSNAILDALVTGGTAGYQYQWSNGSALSEITQLGPGNYSLTVTDSNGCLISKTRNIEQPEALIMTSQHLLPDCFGSRNGRIFLKTQGGQYPYRYSLNGGDFGGDGTFIALPAGNYSLRVLDANGCIASLNDTLWQPPAMAVTLFGDSSIVFGDSLLITAAVSNAFGTTSYHWNSLFTDSITCTDLVYCEEILVKPILSNTYRVTVTDERGCTGKASLAVKVSKPRGVFVPTAFSPNNDLTNDLLVVHGISRQVRRIVTFRIFDRWGEMVYEDQDFEVNQPNRGWDGQFLGQPSDPGVYIWVLEAEYLDGHREDLKGDVTLVR